MGREEVLEGQGIPQSGVEAVDGNHDSNGGVIVSTSSPSQPEPSQAHGKIKEIESNRYTTGARRNQRKQK